jgi:flagellar hook assembly protein FlgD
MNALGEIDSLEHTMTVNVLKESRVLQPYNFPNPFSKETHFTFTLTGEQPPEELRIRIFTVAGRKVRELIVGQAGLQVGINRIPWDGRHDDGDEIANGYYFYQISLTSSDKTISTIEKLVKVK